MPISATYQCQSVPLISAMPVSAAYQCCRSVMPVNAHQCHLPVPPHQCPSVPPISVHHCSLSVPITAASLAHIINEGEKSLIYKVLQ
ncbi:unnamed protein product, partial [Staurois parvus]